MNTTTDPLERARYKSDGRIDSTRMFPLALATLAVAYLMANVLFFLFEVGHYYIFFAPIILVLPVAGMLILAIHYGHCRNRFYAGFLALLAGLVFYIGFFHAGMVRAIGWEHWNRLDYLREYIVFHQSSIVQGDATPGSSIPDGEPIPFLNWFFAAGELLAVCAILIAFALDRASRPYVEGRWFKSKAMYYTPGIAEIFEPVITPEAFEELAQHTPMAKNGNQKQSVFKVEYWPIAFADWSESFFSPAMLTIKESHTALKARIRQVILERDEVEALARNLLPEVAPGIPISTDSDAWQYVDRETFEATPALEDTDRSPTDAALEKIERAQPAAQAGDRFLAESFDDPAWKRPFPYYFKALLELSILLLLFGGPILALVGLSQIPDDAAFEPEHALPIALTAIGFLLLILGIWIALRDPTKLSRLYLRRLLRRRLAGRRELLFDIQSPGVFQARIVPRQNITRFMIDDSDDHGFLKFDTLRREVLYEGDGRRFRIPFEILIDPRIEQFSTESVTSLYLILDTERYGHHLELPVRLNVPKRKEAKLLEKMLLELRQPAGM